MERVGTLLQKLQEQFEQQAGASQLLLTIQQLQAELYHLQQKEEQPASKIVVDLPPVAPVIASQPIDIPPVIVEIEPIDTAPIQQPIAAEEKIVEVLQVDEAAVEAELEEIKRNAAAKNNMSVHYKPVVLTEMEPDVPTLVHQQNTAKELNETIAATDTPSLNEKLKQSSIALGEQLGEPPIRDLKKAIGINDRYLYINELFRGDETMYERSIKTINGFSILPEAEYWIQRELKVKLGWNDSNETVKQFNQLIKRRFS